jgi:hypothetical protein
VSATLKAMKNYRRNEKAGNNEEDIDPDEAASHPAGKGVKSDDGQDGDRTQAIDIRPIIESDRSGLALTDHGVRLAQLLRPAKEAQRKLARSQQWLKIKHDRTTPHNGPLLECRHPQSRSELDPT